MRSSTVYLFRGLLGYFMAVLLPIATVILHAQIGMSIVLSIPVGICIGLLFLGVGHLNFTIYRREQRRLDEKDLKIKELSKRINELENDGRDE